MHKIIIQRVAKKAIVPPLPSLRKWVKAALTKRIARAELTLRIVGMEEMIDLNTTYRKKNGPTNVLSFPFSLPHDIDIDIPLLGDVVICAEVVNDEAEEQKKTMDAHWAHLVIHGTLHLLGYNHEKEEEADVMEAEEISILKQLGFDNPYKIPGRC